MNEEISVTVEIKIDAIWSVHELECVYSKPLAACDTIRTNLRNLKISFNNNNKNRNKSNENEVNNDKDEEWWKWMMKLKLPIGRSFVWGCTKCNRNQIKENPAWRSGAEHTKEYARII